MFVGQEQLRIDFGTAKDLENPQIKGSGNASRHKARAPGAFRAGDVRLRR